MLGAGAAMLAAITIGVLILQASTPRSPSDASPELSQRPPTAESSVAVVGGSPSIAPSPVDGALSEPTSTAEPDPTTTPGPSAIPTSTPTSRPTPEPTPEPTPRPRPAVNLEMGGIDEDLGLRITDGDSVTDILFLKTRDLDRSECTLTQSFVPDDESLAGWERSLKPRAEQRVTMKDGTHTFRVRCQSVDGALRDTFRVTAMDGKPEACKGFDFERGDITATTFEDLAAGVVGTWTGCVTTPWTPMYAVSITFRSDGSYRSSTNEVLDGTRMTALYYGTDGDFPQNRYAITDLQASGLGLGEIDIYFDVAGSVTRDDLRNIRLMGDKLELEMFHRHEYGPLTLRLTRAN